MAETELKETPKEEKYFNNTKNVLFVSNRDAVQAMADAAKKLGLKPRIKTLTFQGEASDALIPLVRTIKKGEAILMAGETTVTLNNIPDGVKPGKGGRNQEAALGVIGAYGNKVDALKGIAAISYASDGHDNVNAAGAIADAYAIRSAAAAKQDIPVCLARHASFDCLRKSDALLLAKKNSFNVADLMLVIKE